MNRYPLWKYILIAVILIVAAVYTLPNFYGESPAVQVSPGKATVKVTEQTLKTVEDALAAAQIKPNGVFFEQGAQQNSVRVRFAPTDGELQLRSRDVLEKALNPDPADPSYIVALNLVPNTPTWLLKINALPMYLGLDLRGGVHFLLAVDMKAAVTKRIEAATGEVRTLLRDHKIRHAGIVRVGDTLEISFRNEQDLEAAMDVLRNRQTDLTFAKEDQNGKFMIRATMSQKAMSDVQSYALKQNVATLHNRINELGVAEPVIAQQGADRIVVQLPGVQDTAKAKDILGRTATLEVRMVDDSPEALAQLSQGTVPFGTERFKDREGRDILVKRQVVLTGDNLNDAQPGFDNQTHEPTVNLTLDAKGARIFKDVTRENVGKRMAIILFEKGKGEVVTAPVIRQEIGGGRVQISGRMSTVEATDTALLLRADRDEVLQTLSTLHPVSGRFEFVRAADGTTAIVDYAHTPDALEKVLQTVEEIRRPGQQLFVLCGCGGDRDKTKRPEMAQIAVKYATTAILTSDNPRHEDPDAILDDMVAGLAPGDRYLRIADRAEAIRTAAMLAKPGDILLLAGKGHETYQIVGDVKHHFDDKEEALRAFALYAKN